MEDRINIICWKWGNKVHPKKGMVYHSQYVNELYRMLQDKCSIPFRLFCFTDDPEGIRPEVLIRPLPRPYSDMQGCWLRLWSFRRQMKTEYQIDRFISMDLDCVITADPAPIFQKKGEFLIWCEHSRQTPYCGSMYAMDSGCREWVWDRFDPKKYPPTGYGPRWIYGTDQFHISNCLYPLEKYWDSIDGVHSFVSDIFRMDDVKYFPKIPRPNGTSSDIFRSAQEKAKKILKGIKRRYTGEITKPPHYHGEKPEKARIIFFNGRFDPADPLLQRKYPWIREYYQWSR